MRFFSEATNYLWVKIALAALIGLCLALGGNARKAGLFAVVSFLLANAMTDGIKDLLPAMRPCQELALTVHDIGCSDNPGTASAHGANMAAAAFAFTYFLGLRWGAPWIAAALITGISRIYVGAHYPWQVAIGWACGVFAALVAIKTWEALVASKSRRDHDAQSA